MDKIEALAPEIHEVTLPSRGALYEGKLPGGVVRIRPLSTREERLLTSPRGVRTSLMYDIVSACICAEDRKKLPFDEYLVGDVVYLFLVLRSVTYEPEYTFEPNCQFCGKPIQVDVSIPADLGVYVMDVDFTEPIDATLPRSGKHVGLRLFRVKDDKAVEAYGQKSREDNVAYSYRIARHIASIDEAVIEDPKSALPWVESLHARDAEAIREAVIGADCGVDLQLDRQCPSCGRMNEVFFEFTADFFRSKSAKVRRRRGTIG